MVDWDSPEELAHNGASFSSFMHALLGLYAWEWVTSLDFDIYLLLGKRKFKWPMIFYLLNRYSILIALVALVAVLNIRTPLDCQSVFIFIQLMGNFAIGLSSINLSVRTIAVWKGNYYVIGPVVLLILGHWGLLLRMVETIHAQWVDGQGCVVIGASVTFNTSVYAYTMVFDFIIMILTGIKIKFGRGDYRSELVRMLYVDGLIYFVIAFVANSIAVIFTLLHLNTIMNIIADVPATTAATIAACRVVRRLSLFVPGQGPDVYTLPQFNIPVTQPTSASGPIQFSNEGKQKTRIQTTMVSRPQSSDHDSDHEYIDTPSTMVDPYKYDGEGRSPVEIKVNPYLQDHDEDRGEGRSPVEIKVDHYPHNHDCENGDGHSAG